MKNILKRNLSGLLALAMVFVMLQSLCQITAFADDTDVIYPVQRTEGISSLTILNSSTTTISDDGSATNVPVTDSGAPVTEAVRYKYSNYDSSYSITKGGIRTASLASSFQVPVANSYVAVSYWVKGENVDVPKIRGILQYLKSGNVSGDTFSDIAKSPTLSLEKDKWMHVYQIFKVENATTGVDSTGSDYAGLRFTLGASDSTCSGQTIYMGGYSVQDFGAEFQYAGKTDSVEAIEAYLSDVSLTDITNGGVTIPEFDSNVYSYTLAAGSMGVINAEAANTLATITYDTAEALKVKITVTSYPYNGGQPCSTPVVSDIYTVAEEAYGENALTDTYNLGAWHMSSVNFYGADYPKLLEEDGRTAIKFWGNPNQDKDAWNNAMQYRGQLEADYTIDSELWETGDKFYLTYWAKGSNVTGEAAKLSVNLVAVTSGGAGNGVVGSGTVRTLTDSWQQYSDVITLNLEQMSNSEDFAGIRLQLNLGYYGQTTYFSGFEMYKCSDGLTDDQIKDYYTGWRADGGMSNLTNSQALATAGSTGSMTSSVGEYGHTVYEYSSTGTGFRARMHANRLKQTDLKENDVILLTYWAKGANGTETTTATLQTQNTAGSGQYTGYKIGSDGAVDKSATQLTGNWKRYAAVYYMPDLGENQLRFEWTVPYSTESGGTTLYLADANVWNLGQIDAADALQHLSDINTGDVFYKTRAMTVNADGTLSAVAKFGEATFDAADFTTLNRGATETYVTNIPSGTTDNGIITCYAADGTSSTVNFTVRVANEVERSAATYRQGSAPNVILKLDDCQANQGLEAFERTIEIAKKYDMNVTIGVVGQYWESATDEQWAKLKSWSDDADIEIWNHGWEHSVQEYSTNSYSQQLEIMKKTQTLMADHGIIITCFGSPNNNSTVITSRMLEDNFADLGITSTLLAQNDTVLFESDILTNFSNRVNIENKITINGTQSENDTGYIDYAKFKINFEKADALDYVVLQGHPYLWLQKGINRELPDGAEESDNYYFDQFDKCLEYLKNEGIQTVLPTSFAAELKNGSGDVSELSSGPITAQVDLTSYDVQDNTIGKSVTLIYAVYDSQTTKLIDCSTKTLTLSAFDTATAQISAVVPNSSDGQYYTKLFVWNSLKGLVPVIEDVEQFDLGI